MQNKILQRKRAMRTALLVLLLSTVGMTKGYAGIIDTIGNIVYQFAGPSPSAPYKYPYNAAIVIGHRDGTDATGPIVIPDSVHWLGNNNGYLVPVARIHGGAFADCSGLTSVSLPNSMEEILFGSFRGCSGLTGDLVIPNSVLSIGPAYYSEWSNGNANLWEGGAFEGCNFTSVTIMAIIPPILSDEWGYIIDPFSDVPCSNLTVPCDCIPVYEASEWNYHFTTIVEDCQTTFVEGNLNYIINSDGITVTVTGHVDGTAATGSLVIPERVNYQGNTYPVIKIDVAAFMGCNSLTSLVLPNSVIEIGHHAFAFCSGFTGDLVLPNTLTTIGWSAFANCSSLNSLTLPNSVTTIENTAFSGCSGLTSLSIPNSVASIGENPFAYCSGLEQIVVEPGNTVFDSRNNCNAIIKTCTNELISGCMNSSIPSSVTIIGNSAFTGCYGLTSLTLPNLVTKIGEKAFWDCNGLTSIIFPNSVTTIGEKAFYYCNGLTNIISLTTTPPVLGDGAFSGVLCTMLTVLCGCVPAYEVSDWAIYFTTIEDDCASHVINIDGSNISGGSVSTSVNSINMGEEVQIIVTPEEGMMLLSLIVFNSDNPYQQVYVYPIGKLSLTYGFIMPPFDVIITATFGPATSIDENSEAIASVYPNPTNGKIIIEAENLKHITISNTLGQVIYDGNAIGNTFEFNFSKHETGIYLIRIETMNGVAVKKISVTR